MKRTLVSAAAGCLLTLAAAVADPFATYLDGKAPEIVREVAATSAVPGNVRLRPVVFRSRDNSEIYAVIASPRSPGRHPGMLVLHGGGGCAEVDKAVAWAQRGYVAVAPDLPGIAEPKKLTESRGRWSALKYGEGRWVATPDAGASVIFDAVLSAMKALELLRAQPDVDPSRIGVVGISWGGYMTTMVCGLAGERVRAGFAVFGCGFYELTSQLNGPGSTLGKMPEEDRARWLEHLDAGRRAPGIRAAFFIAGAANDFFYWPRAVQATLDAIPGEKKHLYAPNANHKVPLPGGTVFPKETAAPFTPTAFQPYPTPSGSKANWLAMEVPYFDYYLKGEGRPLPRVAVQKADSPRLARVAVDAPLPVKSVEIWWAKADPDVMKRAWQALPAVPADGGRYEAQLPPEADDWFAVVSDERPVTVSSDLVHVAAPVVRPAQGDNVTERSREEHARHFFTKELKSPTPIYRGWARLYLGQNLQEGNADLRAAYADILKQTGKGAAEMTPEIAGNEEVKWQLRNWVRVYFEFGERGRTARGRLEPETNRLIENLFWNYACNRSHWARTTRPASDVYGTENHEMMHYGNVLMALQALKDCPAYRDRALPEDGHTAREHFEAWNAYYKEHFVARARFGDQIELFSGYWKYTMPEVLNMSDLAEDPPFSRTG
jgi:dienelactone hydrolase